MKIITDNEGIRKSRKMALELMLSNHYADCLIRLGIPTHAIWGEKDAINPLETARELVASQPNAKLTVLPEVGHLPQQEAPAALLRALSDS
jgi:pimeloyl-ACP methyl ester carboxylesterase